MKKFIFIFSVCALVFSWGISEAQPVKRITDYTFLAVEPATSDELLIYDVSAPAATATKKISISTMGLAFVYDTAFSTAWASITGKAPSARVIYDKIITLAPIASPTFTGKVTTAAGATGSAPLRIPHGYAPTSPMNGDVWTTSSGMYVFINGVTIGPIGVGGGGGGGGGSLSDLTNPTVAKTFTLIDNDSSALSFGAAGRADILKIVTTDGSEAVTMAGGLTVSGSTSIQSPFTLGGTSVTTTGTQMNYLNITTGRTGTGSVTLNISPTFSGTPNAPTAPVDTSSPQIASTAFVLGQISNTAYGAGWNGITTQAPSKNAVYDEMELRLLTPSHVGGRCVLGYNDVGADGTLGCYNTVSNDDSAAQFYNAADSTKKVKIDASNQSAGNTGTIQAPNGGTATLVAGTMLVASGAFGTPSFTALNMPSSDSDPGTTAGQIKHDSVDTNASGGGSAKYYDGTNVRTLIDSGTNYTILVKTEYLPVGYMEDGATAPTAAAVTASTRKVKTREFSGSADNDVEIHWMVPDDYVGGIKFRWVGFVTNATAPAATEVIAFSLAGCSLGNSEVLGCSAGTAQTSSLTADASYVQYDRAAGAYSSAITITGIAAGESAMLKLTRLATTTDTYGQAFGLAGIEIKYQAKVMLNATY